MLDKIDSWKSDWNFLSATKAQRYTAVIMSGIALFLWIVRGWDSGIGAYGTSLHYSVFVIYGLEYAYLNFSLARRGIKGIRNLVTSVMITIGSVTLFEWYWGIGYALFHGETWVLTTENTVLTELIVITIIGIAGILYAKKQGMTPRRCPFLLGFITPAIIWYLLGFPQTCYPAPNGTIIYIENNITHLYNVLAKLGLAFAHATMMVPFSSGKVFSVNRYSGVSK